MSNIVKFNDISDKIITVRRQKSILDSDVAELYGVDTKEITQAVKNNPKKFLSDYIIKTTTDEKKELVKNFDRFNRLKHSTVCPNAFTEKGLYMLATILTGDKAIETTIAIIEAFAKLRELARTVAELSVAPDEFQQKSLMQKGGEIIAEILDDDLQVTDTETSIELNFALLKFKHTIKRKN
jgi:phage regulator Rha-like protein